jgi:glutathione synthase/RimK-type ligase-like ATP-grasp enzyme
MPLALAISEAERRGLRYILFHQRKFAETEIQIELEGGEARGWLKLCADKYSLDDIVSVYTRIMDDTLLPEIICEPPDSPLREHCRRLHHQLNLWFELSRARIVNRTSAMGSNGSKPYQAKLIKQAGFDIPETLITNDPEEVRAFRARHGRIVYKSISGVRSIVQVFSEDDDARLDTVRWCPTQFQEFVDGVDVRVHVIGKTVIATEAWTDAVDYRYATQQGLQCTLIAVDLESELQERCINLAAMLQLDFAGIDLRRCPNGRIICFEVNPCPAYSFYQQNTAQPIAKSLVQYLAWERN